MKNRVLLWLLLLFSVVGANAQTLTVCDGTYTSTYVPVEGLWADAYQRSQYVIPAADLEEMKNGTISSMTFYLTSSVNRTWGGNFQVYLMEVGYTSISSFELTSDATIVYDGSLDGSGTTMTVTFSTPYIYGGGNLLVGFDHNVKSSYASCTFYGLSVNGASVQNHNSSSLSSVGATQRNFIPKTTFEYTPAFVSCPKPTDLVASNITATSADLLWTAGGSETEWQIMINDEEENLISVNSTSYSLTGLPSGTDCTVKVRAVCGTDDVSFWTSVSFSTPYSAPFFEGFESFPPVAWGRYSGLASSVFSGSSLSTSTSGRYSLL